MQPRQTIRQIIHYDPEYNVSLIVGLIGIIVILDKASDKGLGEHVSFASVLFIAVIFGPITGIIRLHIMSRLIAWTGPQLGGHGDSREIRTALAWSEVPNLLSFGLWGAYLFVAGELMFKKEMLFETEADLATAEFVMFAGTGIAILLSLWSFVLKLKALGEVQEFSAWRALGNLILASLVILVPFLALAFCLLIPVIANGQ